MIYENHRILGEENYIPLKDVKRNEKLYKGRIYTTIKEEVTSGIVILVFLYKLKERRVKLSSDLYITTFDGIKKVQDVNVYDRIIIYNDRKRIEEVTTVTLKTLYQKPLKCILPITTKKIYIIEGLILNNAGLS